MEDHGKEVITQPKKENRHKTVGKCQLPMLHQGQVTMGPGTLTIVPKETINFQPYPSVLQSGLTITLELKINWVLYPFTGS